MKKLLYMAVAAIAVLSSCDKNDALLDDNGNGVDNTNAPVFTATIESEATTKTQLATGSTENLKKVEWLSSDKVFIGAFNGEYAPVVLGEYSVTPGSPATTATLTPGSNLKYTAIGTSACVVGIYPASISFVGALSNETIANIVSNNPQSIMQGITSLILPATQTYNGNDISKIAPMMGIAMGNTELTFTNLTALLAITVPSTQMNSVQKITVSSDKQLNGDFDASMNGNVWELAPDAEPADETKTLDLICNPSGANTTIASGESKTFYVSIPPATYGYLQIEVTDGTNTKTMRTTAASIEVVRNKIYPIAFADNQTPAHAYVDLGLSVKWATMNVGATTIVGYGDYFAWGATEPLYEAGYAQESPQAHWKTGKSSGYCFYNTPYQTVNTTNDSSTKWTKYLGSTTSSYKNSSATRDDLLKTVLDAGDDAASANWGGSWRMPTREEWAELINSSNCKWTWTTQEGIKGYKVQSKKAGYTDNWIFLPAAGQRINTRLDYLGSSCNYWSSSLYEPDPCAAGSFEGNEYNPEVCDYNRLCGFSVRPVCE